MKKILFKIFSNSATYKFMGAVLVSFGLGAYTPLASIIGGIVTDEIVQECKENPEDEACQ